MPGWPAINAMPIAFSRGFPQLAPPVTPIRLTTPACSRGWRAASVIPPAHGARPHSTSPIPAAAAKGPVSTIAEQPAWIATRSTYPLPPASNVMTATLPATGEAAEDKKDGSWCLKIILVVQTCRLKRIMRWRHRKRPGKCAVLLFCDIIQVVRQLSPFLARSFSK
jgi:hypothetical protein